MRALLEDVGVLSKDLGDDNVVWNLNMDYGWFGSYLFLCLFAPSFGFVHTCQFAIRMTKLGSPSCCCLESVDGIGTVVLGS